MTTSGLSIGSEPQATAARGWSAATLPLVSICSTTYNHARFIAQALDGFLMQRTAFPVEIIIHDDCSTDGTAAIIQDYQRRHPDRMVAILQSQNQHRQGRHVLPFLLQRARGKYVAICEGDDYWTSADKLAHQVRLLEQDPGLSACVHACEMVDADGKVLRELPQPATYRETIAFEELVRENQLPTASLMFRRERLPAPPAWADGLIMLDWPCLLELAAQGPLRFLPEKWCAYRIHGGGLWTANSQQRRLEHTLEFYRRVARRFPDLGGAVAQLRQKETLAALFQQADGVGDRRQACRWLWQYWLSRPGPGRLPPFQRRAVLRTVCGWPARPQP